MVLNSARCVGYKTLNVLVTGASGFIGSGLVKALSEINTISCTVLERTLTSAHGVSTIKFTGFDDLKCLSAAVHAQSVVVHCAGRSQVMSKTSMDSLVAFRKVNVEGTLNLARAALDAGVKRFVFISSIKVNGEYTLNNVAFSADDIPRPESPYGVSKYEAEIELTKLLEGSSMELVVIRPPLVYGPGVKGNFANLINLCKTKRVLPFGAIKNKRSYVSVDNLVSLIIVCLVHPKAANEVFLVSDNDDLSTTHLIKSISEAFEFRICLVAVPSFLLVLVATLLGKKAMALRLLGSLQIDISKTRRKLGWEPPISVADGLRRSVDPFGYNSQ